MTINTSNDNNDSNIVRSFNQTDIWQKRQDGYINLNQMANATGKRIDHWLENKSTNTFLKRFSKDAGVSLVAIRGRGKGGTWAHPEIAKRFWDWCNNTRSQTKSNIVYLVQSENFLKIGLTAESMLLKRLSTLQTGNPITLKLLSTIKGEEKEEKLLHLKYKDLLVRGEWFHLSREILDEFHYSHSSPQHQRCDPYPKATKPRRSARRIQGGIDQLEIFPV